MELLFQQFLKSSEKTPEKTAIWCDGETRTYVEMHRLICCFANYLTSRGVKRNDIIGIPMTNCIESVALIFAASALGAGLAPINPTVPAAAADLAFRSANVTHVIARKAFYKSAEKEWTDKTKGCRLCLDGSYEDLDTMEDVLNAPDTLPTLENITGDEPLILTLTSGSTGEPKPIVLTQNNKIKRADAHIRLYGITENDIVLAATPLYHSLAERLVIMPLLIGGTSVLLPRFTPVIWLKCVRDQAVTFTIAVSAQLGQIAQLLSSPYTPEISSLRCVVSSSALLEPHVRRELIEKLECDFHEMYGTSECSTVTDIGFKETGARIRSVGRPLPGVSIRILDDDGNEKPVGEIGEITVKTPLQCAGYYRMEEKTKEAFCGEYFKTGDLGKLDEDGYLYFAGRKKEIIITGGVNVYPKDVEDKISELDGVQECASFAYPDERLGEVVAVAVVAKPGSELTRKKLQLYCARNLADFQQPHKIFLVKDLPRNAMGKIVKMKLNEHVAGMEG